MFSFTIYYLNKINLKGLPFIFFIFIFILFFFVLFIFCFDSISGEGGDVIRIVNGLLIRGADICGLSL